MLTLGLPNGSLFESTIALLKRVGITVRVEGRKFVAAIEGTKIFSKAFIMRPQDIPEAVDDEVIDVGIAGWDCVVEAGYETTARVIVNLPYGRRSKNSVRVVIFGKSEQLIDEEGILVSAEYPNLAKRFFKKARVKPSAGSSEVKVAYFNKYDYGVGIVESGESLTANGLKVLKDLLISPVVLISGIKSPEIEYFGRLLKGGLQGENNRLIKMDVSVGIKDSIISILPAIQSPTISNLADGGFAIETVVNQDDVVDLAYKLEQLGAKGVLVQDLKIVL